MKVLSNIIEKKLSSFPFNVLYLCHPFCVMILLLLNATVAYAETENTKFRAFEANFIYSFPFNQGGVEVSYIGGKLSAHSLKHEITLGMRYQKLNPYERSNREFRAGWGMRYQLPEKNLFNQDWRIFFGAGPYLSFFEDIERPEPLFDDKIWRWGLGARISTGIQLTLSESWLAGISVKANAGFMTNYPKDYAPIYISSRPYLYFALLPQLGIMYQLSY
jgi:hypothetical protein